MPRVSTPPAAAREPFEHTEHGVVRPDPYHWLRRTDSTEVLAHLRAERDWYETATTHLHSLVEALRDEMSDRLPDAEVVTEWRLTECSYLMELPPGKEYPQVLRVCDADFEPERPNYRDFHTRGEVILDANQLEDGSGYVELGTIAVSPDERMLAYSVDTVGDEVYRLRFRDVTTGADLAEEVPRTYYGGAWTADSTAYYYTVHDDAYRPHQVWRHRLGTDAADDELVLTEGDQHFELMLRATRSGDLVVIWSSSRDTTEVWVVDAHDPAAEPRSVGGRRPGVEYHVEHAALPEGDRLLLVTDDDAVEFRLCAAPVPRDSDQDHSSWEEVAPARRDERLERVDAFTGHAVLTVRTPSGRRLRVVPTNELSAEGHSVPMPFPAGVLELGPNTLPGVDRARVVAQDHVHPPVWTEVDLVSGEMTLLHREEAPGHDPEHYVTEQRTLDAGDGRRPVPVTLVRHRDTPLDGTAPALVYGYGAYEYTFEPEWDPALPSLLDRGVVYVHAHVRGGGEQGRRGWLDGRMGTKQHTFDDFAHVGDALEGLVDGDRLAARGLSAGGLLMAGTFSQRPDRWRAVVAEVPFVDVVTTLFDPSIPLTINEWEEWGNPAVREEFDWLLAYSPYENLPPAGDRPDLLVTAALHDPRVMVWEPAKWVAALRESDPDWSPRCLFRCELGAGSHVGPTGRYAHLAYEAEVLAWVLDRLGVTGPPRT